jgi:hypothetical protein
VEHDARQAALAEVFAHFELAVAVGIAEGDDAALVAIALQRDVSVAVRRHCDVARLAQIVGHDQRAEARRKLDSAVIRIAVDGAREVECETASDERNGRKRSEDAHG